MYFLIFPDQLAALTSVFFSLIERLLPCHFCYYMSKKATIASFGVIAVILLLYFSNPGERKHITFLEKKYNIQIDWKKGTDSFVGSDGDQFIYNNYYFFSTTSSMTKTGERSSIGFLWIVF